MVYVGPYALMVDAVLCRGYKKRGQAVCDRMKTAAEQQQQTANCGVMMPVARTLLQVFTE